MKNDLLTAIGAAVAGLIIAFFATNLLKGEIEPFTVKTISDSVNVDLVDPDPEIFNYRALNPTVEVYIGSCLEYNENGECVILVEGENEEELNEGPVEENP